MKHLRAQKITACILVASILFSATSFVFSPKVAMADLESSVRSQGQSEKLERYVNYAAGPVSGALGDCLSAAFLGKGLSEGEALISTVPTSDGGTATAVITRCLDDIAVAAAQIVLNVITNETINWINRGFSGEPLFLKNSQSFFANMGKDATHELFSAIGYDPDNFPFADENFMENILNSISRRFEDNARISREFALGGDWYTFRSDFNNGGWDAYLALAEPNNNPTGFKNLVQKDLASRLQGTVLSAVDKVKNELLQSGGYLSLDKCIASDTGLDDYIADKTWDRADADGRLAQARMDLTSTNITIAEQAEVDIPLIQKEIDQHHCKDWETQTPGQAVATKINQSITADGRRLELAKDMTSSLAAITDALLNHFIEKGLAGMAEEDDNSGLAQDRDIDYSRFGGYGNNSYTYNATPNTRPNDDFNINTDLTDIQDIQIEYEQQLVAEMDAIQNLITKIYELDFCIPGPNPNWKADADVRMAEIVKSLGAISNATSSAITIKNYTNLEIDQSPDSGQIIDTVQETADVLNTILARYAALISEVFKPTNLPASAAEGAREFKTIPEYQQQIADLEKRAATQNELIAKIAILISQLQPNSPEATETLTSDYIIHIANYLKTQTDIDDEIKNINAITGTNGKIPRLESLITSCKVRTTPPQEHLVYPADLLPNPDPTIATKNSFLFSRSVTPNRNYIYGDNTQEQGNVPNEIIEGMLQITDKVTFDTVAQPIAPDLSKFEQQLGVY
ncbi:MAG: hypothetical protein WC795_02155 [Candidatus Paceibacterota bacterium]|jgi:hypothetical protein